MTATTKAGRQGAYLWRWAAEALQRSPSTGPTLHLASQVREEEGELAIPQRCFEVALDQKSGSMVKCC